MATTILSGAHVKIRINGTIYPLAQSISYSISSGETEIYGVDSIFPQEIAPTTSSVSGRIDGLKIARASLQSLNIRDPNSQIMGSGYNMIEVLDRKTKSVIISFPMCRVSDESFSIQTKSTARLSFSFKAILSDFGVGLDV